MHLYHIASLLFSVLTVTLSNGEVLLDFTTLRSVDNWIESSDTVSSRGMSKAVLAIQSSQSLQRAVFFTLLNPQPTGAGFAGVYTRPNWNLQKFDQLNITCRAQGENNHYKVVLRHKNATIYNAGYEQTFEVPISNSTFSNIILPLKDFKPYSNGKAVEGAEALDLTNITMFTFQMYGGVYLPYKQSGASALEIVKVQALNSTAAN